MSPTALLIYCPSRRVLNSVCACALVAVACVAALPSASWAQSSADANFPTAIISSGGSTAAESNGQLDGGQSSARVQSQWLAGESTDGLRPQSPPASAVRGQAPASGAQSHLASTATPSSSPVQHIPLAPPTERLKDAKPKGAASTLKMLVSVISSLLLVVGLFLGVAWCYRKTMGTALAGGLPKQVVQVLGRTSISTRQQMVLVRFGSKLLLVSVIQGEARTLSEISDPLEVDQMLGLCEGGQPGSISQSFKSVLYAGEKP